MKSKKLIRNVLVMLVALMTTVMVLSSCSNASDSEYANITIRLSGSGTGRAISSEEKAAATFNVYFNNALVGQNVAGTFTGMAEVGTMLHIRVDTLVNGKRIAIGENTITVRAGSPPPPVSIKADENRESESTEQGTHQQPVIPYRELSTAHEGDVICANGKVLSASDITTELQSQTIAVVYKVDTNARKAWAVGKNLNSSNMVWAETSADGCYQDITDLREENGYTDGSTGLSILQREASDAITDLENMYPAWDYACNYGTKQGLNSFQTGWYLPSKQELQEVYNKKDAIEAALAQAGVSKISFVTDNCDYWSSYQCDSNDGSGDAAYLLNFDSGTADNPNPYKFTGANVCAVRAFTY